MAWPLKENEANKIAAFFHVLTLLLACVALAQPGWFRLRGARCAPHLAPSQFFTTGQFSEAGAAAPPQRFKLGNVDEVMTAPATVSYLYTSTTTLACVTPRLASMMRTIIMLCFMVIIFSLMGVFLNVASPRNETLKVIQRNSMLSVMCVLWVMAVVGVSYYVTLVAKDAGGGKRVEVSYEYGFYTITSAGVVAVLGAAINLMTGVSPELPSIQRRHLLDNWDSLDGFSIGPGSGVPQPEGRRGRRIVIVSAFAPTGRRGGGRGGRGRQIPGGTRRAAADSTSLDSDLVSLTPPPPYTP